MKSPLPNCKKILIVSAFMLLSGLLTSCVTWNADKNLPVILSMKEDFIRYTSDNEPYLEQKFFETNPNIYEKFVYKEISGDKDQVRKRQERLADFIEQGNRQKTKLGHSEQATSNY